MNMIKRLVSGSTFRFLLATGAFALVFVSPGARATILSLTTSGANNFTPTEAPLNGAYFFEVTAAHPTNALFGFPGGSSGTGVMDSFLRITDNTGTAEGYNSETNEMSQVGDSQTREFQLSDLSNQIITLGDGRKFYQFLFDKNQNADLSITEIQIYTRATAFVAADFALAPTDADKLLVLQNTSTLRYDLDSLVAPLFDATFDGDSTIILSEASGDSGSGRADLVFWLPIEAFTGALSTDYVYFYSKITGEDTGFEEWGYLAGGIIPEPTTVLFGALLMGTLVWRERSRLHSLALAAYRRSAAGDAV